MFSRDHYKLFQELVSCNYELYFWEYNKNLRLLDSTCPQKDYVDRLFELNGCKEYLKNYIRDFSSPMDFTDEMGLIWAAVFSLDKQNRVDRILVMGPAFLNDNYFQQFARNLDRHALSVTVRRKMYEFSHHLPVISSNIFYQYLLMFHRCIREEPLSFRQIMHKTLITGFSKNTAADEKLVGKIRRDTYHTTPGSTDAQKLSQNYIYQSNNETQMRQHAGIRNFEKELTMAIQQGNLAALDMLGRGALISSGVKASFDDPMQQSRYSCVMLITICSRAAIDGGLSPDIAFSLCDLYTNAVDRCQSANDIKNLNDAIIHDFVSRVHECRKHPDVSAPIAACLDYISIHIRDQISMESLAALTGYTPYYLTGKFKREMGISISRYIQREKISYAKMMLSSGEDSITDISEALHFCTQSYFTKIFTQETGLSPSAYREQSRRQ